MKMEGRCTVNVHEGTSRWKVSVHSTVYVQRGDENGR